MSAPKACFCVEHKGDASLEGPSPSEACRRLCAPPYPCWQGAVRGDLGLALAYWPSPLHA